MTARADANHQTLAQPGHCRAHGVVQATKQVPKIRFPFIVYGALRLWASRRPFTCPVCGETVGRA
ncbi:MAG TPA: hypothetical protein VKV26_14670 [Dehalococcoidia bacterium]|nr:hypothetical protein [Dehalococcoidia bacterium]